MGLNYMNTAYTRNTAHCFVIAFCMLMGFSSVVYTMAVFDHDMMLKSLTMMPVVCQGIVKYHVYTSKTHILRSHVVVLKDIYTQCDSQKHEAVILNVWARILQRVIKVFQIIVGATAFGFCTVPPYTYFTTGKLTFLMPMFIPYFDVNTVNGYSVQLLFQILMISIGALGLIFADLTMCIQILHLCPLSDVLVRKLRRLERLLTDFPHYAQRRQTTIFLNNFICMHKEYCMFLKSMADMYYIVILGDILLNGLNMCVVEFVLMQVMWFPLYMFWILFMSKTLITCVLGTISEHYVRVDQV